MVSEPNWVTVSSRSSWAIELDYIAKKKQTKVKKKKKASVVHVCSELCSAI